MDWLDLLAVQGTLESLLQHHSSKASILWGSAFFTVQLSHPYVTTGKTIALTGRTFVDKVMSLLFNMLSRLVITFLPRSKHLLISWLQSPSAVILEPPQKSWNNTQLWMWLMVEAREGHCQSLNVPPTWDLWEDSVEGGIYLSSTCINLVLNFFLKLSTLREKCKHQQ